MNTIVLSTSKFKIALLSALFWGVIFICSLWWNLQVIEQNAYDNAANRGRFVFEMIETTRLWNAKHGGVYVKRNEWTPSNKYLNTPEKDIQTPQGVRLTKMNPAYMTRQLAGLIFENNQTKVHLTSLKPINPGNYADEWESLALKSFEANEKERFEIVTINNQPIVRYMAPLFVKPPCMTCHEKQDYRVGDVRGGISVSFSAEPFITAIKSQEKNMIGIHIIIWLLLTAVTHYLFKKIREHEDNLLLEKNRQEHLVELRTSDLKKEVHMRRSAEEKIRLLVDTSAQAILGLDNQGKITFANPAAHSILGYKHTAEMVGKQVYDLLQIQDAKGKLISKQECQFISAFSRGVPGHSEDETFLCADGKQLAVEYSTHPLFSDNELVGAVINFSDISNRKLLQQAMWHQANYDQLTDVPNRSLFMDRLQTAINQAKRVNSQLALMYLDLNGFKIVNDIHGHYAGDEVLRCIASRIQGLLRETDTLARQGGDEFTVLLSNIIDHQDTMNIAENIVQSINQSIRYENESLKVGVSIGIAIYPEHADNLTKLVKAADQAMYHAKADSSKNIYFFSNELEQIRLTK